MGSRAFAAEVAIYLLNKHLLCVRLVSRDLEVNEKIQSQICPNKRSEFVLLPIVGQAALWG